MKWKQFNNTQVTIQGWYWVCRSNQLKRRKIRAETVMNRDLAVYRTDSNQVLIVDAYCPHMGAHLAEGKVEGENLRCFFHHWGFAPDGSCFDIPCLEKKPASAIKLKQWPATERYGLIWVWIGDEKPGELPCVPELEGIDVASFVGKPFIKQCHPNVVMINAIDEQHFKSVHKLPGSVLHMQPMEKNVENIEFKNIARPPNDKRIWRLINRFYEDAITYDLSYWYGSVGTVTLGPKFFHFHILFALRLNQQGQTEGYMIACTRKRRGLFGKIANAFILSLTKIVGKYFAIGDTRIFKTIQFSYQTPTELDRAIIAFIQHLELQPHVESWAQG